MIVWLASFPRSGNSFFRVASKSLFDQKIYSIYPEKNAPVSAGELEDMRQDSSVYLVKTHEMPIDSSPAIYLVRDGRDSLVSLAWFHLTSRTDPDRKVSTRKFNKTLKKEILSKRFGGWSDNCRAWTQRPEQTVIIRFEDLISKPQELVPNALEAIGLGQNRNERLEPPTFEELHQQNPFLFRKGKIGGWRNQMSEDLHTLFWKKQGEAMRLLGYKP